MVGTFSAEIKKIWTKNWKLEIFGSHSEKGKKWRKITKKAKKYIKKFQIFLRKFLKFLIISKWRYKNSKNNFTYDKLNFHDPNLAK